MKAPEREGTPERASGWRLRSPTWLPFVLVLASLGTALGAYYKLFGGPFMVTVMGWTAQSTAAVLNTLGAGTWAKGNLVLGPRLGFEIVPECTALGPLFLYWAAVVAFPSSLQAKALGLILGGFVLLGLNMIRLVSLFYIGSYSPRLLDPAHYLVWQSLMIIAAILLWLLWLERLVHAHR